VGYLQRLRELCTQHGILLIFDEVITGFGRTGQPFAAQTFGVVPDMITCAKGLTNGCVPMGAVIVKDEIHDAFMTGPEQAIEFAHGYTYSGHPLACAAGLGTLDTYAEEGLLTRASEMGAYFAQAVHSLRGEPHVIDVRNIGLVGGIELAPLPGQATQRAFNVFLDCYDKGLLIRTTGDTIALSPPLIIERGHIDQIVDTLRGPSDAPPDHRSPPPPGLRHAAARHRPGADAQLLLRRHGAARLQPRAPARRCTVRRGGGRRRPGGPERGAGTAPARLDVLLLEARELGYGASGRNGGQAIHGLACDQEIIEDQLGLADARRVWDMSLQALDLLRERITAHAIDCDWQDGYLGLACNARKGRALARWADRLESVYGYALQRIAPADMGRWIASPRFHSAAFTIHAPGTCTR
jgi:hypothetical protein